MLQVRQNHTADDGYGWVVRTIRGGNYDLLCISGDDKIRVVGNEDDLTAPLRLTNIRHQLLING